MHNTNEQNCLPIFARKALVDAVMGDVDVKADEENKVILEDIVIISGEDIEYLKRMYSSLDRTPREIAQKVKEDIIGQDDAIDEVTRVIYYNQMLNLIEEISGEEYDRANILLIGDTGVGKTAIIRSLSKQFNMPLIIYSADSITASGWVGNCVEDILIRLYFEAGEDLAIAERGIIYIDEFDKKVIQYTQNGKDINGRAVQQELLKIFEASSIDITLPNKTKIVFNTGKLTVIAGGYFDGLNDVRKKRLNKSKVGFESNSEEDNVELRKTGYISKDLIDYGFIPELVGRIVKIKELHKLNAEDIFNIMVNGKNSIYRQLTKVIVNYLNIDLQISFDFLRTIAKNSIDVGTNARALKAKLWNAFAPIIEEGLQNRKKEGICIVEANGEYILEYDDVSFYGTLSDEN